MGAADELVVALYAAAHDADADDLNDDDRADAVRLLGPVLLAYGVTEV